MLPDNFHRICSNGDLPPAWMDPAGVTLNAGSKGKPKQPPDSDKSGGGGSSLENGREGVSEGQ